MTEPVQVGERLVWVGSELDRPVGSSGKCRARVGRRTVEMDWGDRETTCILGVDVVKPETAGRGIDGWESCAS